MTNTNMSEKDVALKTVAGFFAYGFGSGLAPFAPGTFGTLAAIPFAIALKFLSVPLQLAVIAVAFAAGIYLCDISSRRAGRKDPGGIVWDEMVAYWLTVVFLPFNWAWLGAAFVVFRVFDIFKPWPIPMVERRFRGGLGVMLDDIVAAVYAMLVLHSAAWLLARI
mgnify:FL=1